MRRNQYYLCACRGAKNRDGLLCSFCSVLVYASRLAESLIDKPPEMIEWRGAKTEWLRWSVVEQMCKFSFAGECIIVIVVHHFLVNNTTIPLPAAPHQFISNPIVVLASQHDTLFQRKVLCTINTVFHRPASPPSTALIR